MALPELITTYDTTNKNDVNDAQITTYLSKHLNKINNVDSIEQTNRNNIRHIQLNENAILKYKAQTKLLKKIIIICCIALIGSFLFYLDLISNTPYNIYVGLVFGIGIILVMYDLYDIFMRSSYDFKQYDYEFIYTPPLINANSKNYNTIQLSNIPTVCK
jgi:hypothetical protein